METPRYFVRTVDGQSGPIAQVVDSRDGEILETYSRRTSRHFRLRARDVADALNASDARVEFNAAHDDLLPYHESCDYQRDMED